MFFTSIALILISEFSFIESNDSVIQSNNSFFGLNSIVKLNSVLTRNDTNSSDFGVGFELNERSKTSEEEEEIPADNDILKQTPPDTISDNQLENESFDFKDYFNLILKYGIDFDFDLFNRFFNSSDSYRNESINENIDEIQNKHEFKDKKIVIKNELNDHFHKNHANNITVQDLSDVTERETNQTSLDLPSNSNSSKLDETNVFNASEASVHRMESFITDPLVKKEMVSKQNNSRNESQRYCISHIDCDIDLNERCVKRNKQSICDCNDPFFREMSSNKCQIKKLIRLLFTITSNHTKVTNNSIEWIQLKHSIEAIIWSVITNSSYLVSIVDDIKAIELKNSQIVVDFYVKIADPSNDLHHKYIEYKFWYQLMSSIRGIDFESQSLKKFNMRAVEVVNDISYCSVKPLNYCSEFADCFDDLESEPKFYCKCKPGLTDMSANIKFSGEVCALKCSADLCGLGGVCEVKNQTEIHCVCKNWNFGDRCQYSMNALLAVISLIGLLSIFFSFCLTALYCGFKIHEEFVELRKMIDANPERQNQDQRSNNVRII